MDSCGVQCVIKAELDFEIYHYCKVLLATGYIEYHLKVYVN